MPDNEKTLKLSISTAAGAGLAIVLGLILTGCIYLKLIPFQGVGEFQISFLVYLSPLHDFVRILKFEAYSELRWMLIPIFALIVGGFVSAKISKNGFIAGALIAIPYAILNLVIFYATFSTLEDTALIIIQVFLFGLIFGGIGGALGKTKRSGVKVEEAEKEGVYLPEIELTLKKIAEIISERIKIPKTELSAKKITGIIIAVAGLFLLLYSFIAANDLVSGRFAVDERFAIKLIFFICMIGIGSYLTEKGAALTEKSKIVGVMLTPVGLVMLCFTFVMANTFVNRVFVADESFFINIFFFVCMIGIGSYLAGKGVALTDYPKITGAILTSIGVFMLLFSFITANKFVSGEFSMAKETLTFVIRIVFFICMIGIGGYLTGRGASEIMKK